MCCFHTIHLLYYTSLFLYFILYVVILQLQVCTVYACVNSTAVQGSTAESRPQGFASPVLQVLSATGVKASWSEPEHPNGILLHYSLYRRNVTDCPDT